MENFFIRAKTRLDAVESFLYDDSALVEGRSLKVDGKVVMTLPFTPLLFKNLSFDYFFISESGELYRVNKYKMTVENIGRATDKIVDVAYASDKVAVLTTKEVLVFNAYFDLERSRLLEGGENKENSGVPHKIRFGDGVIAVIFPACTVMLDFDLKITGRVEESISDAVFIKRYNKFACLVPATGSVRFFEPNGLEHGCPFEALGERICIMNIDGFELLLVSDSATVTAYFMKNFFWYKKFTVAGRFFGVEHNAILTRDRLTLAKYHVFRELSSGLVIDGCNLYYTNLQKAIIPPPMYLRKVSLPSQVLSFFLAGDQLYVLTSTGVHLFAIDGSGHVTEGASRLFSADGISQPHYADIVVAQDTVYVRTDTTFLALEKTLAGTRPLNLPRAHPSDVLKLYSMGDQLVMFCTDGRVLCGHLSTPFNFTLQANFNLQFSEEFKMAYFLSNGVLQRHKFDPKGSEKLEEMLQSASISKEDHPETYLMNVTSFLIDGPYILYIVKGTFNAVNLKDTSSFSSYAEDGLEIITLRGECVIFYTRFGTLETVSIKLLNLSIVERLIAEGDIKTAAQKCDQNHIDYSVFFKDGKFDAENIQHFDDSQALSLFDCMKLPNTKFLLDSEHLARLTAAFDPKFVTENTQSTGPLECVASELLVPFLDEIPDTTLTSLRNCDFLSEPPAFDATLTLNPTFSNINTLLKHLNPRTHFTTFINILIAFNRVDLCFHMPDLQRVIKVLLTKLSAETICKASLRSFDLEKIIATHKQCQRDYVTFVSFYKSAENQQFAVLDYLEDYASALFYLVKATLSKSTTTSSPEFVKVAEYTVKHSLFNQLLMFTFYNVFEFNFYEFVAQNSKSHDAFRLYRLAGNTQAAIEIGKKKLLWKETLELDASPELCHYFIDSLVQASKFSDAGEIVEVHFKDHSSAVELYLRDRNFRKAMHLFKTAEFGFGLTYDNIKRMLPAEKVGALIRSTALSYLKNDLVLLAKYKSSFDKYKERLELVRERLNENMGGSQTTFSYSSVKSANRALLKDRPGGVFENEYVMNKLRTVVMQLDVWRVVTLDLIAVLEEFGEYEAVDLLKQRFEPIKTTLRRDVESIWNYKRADVDIELPSVSMPNLPDFYD